MSALLEVSGLSKTFYVRKADPIRAVDDVSFDLESGGALAIVGESGSGKTTVARIVAGLEHASGGTVRVSGNARAGGRLNRRDRKNQARDVQMVFQDPYSSLDPRQTIEAAIGEVIREHFPVARAERHDRVMTAIQRVGLDERHASVRPGSLSGGERQRAAIARSLAVEPRILILDEAVSALDVSVQAQVLNLLADLRSEIDIAYLFISHDLGVVRHVSDSCLVMHNGKIVETGDTEKVLTRPAANYTKNLLSAIPGPGWKPRRRGLTSVGS